jgi:alpha-L-fucosidase
MLLFVLCGLLSERVLAQYTPTPENLAARQWFDDAQFGLFIHWGVYSVLGNGEWVMNNEKIPISDYEKLPSAFNPVKFDAAAWVAMVKAAGMKYITITSKHHDGFAMYDSKVSDWDLVERSPYGKDVLAMLAEECRKQGIKLFFYHSQLDWHHPDYFPRGFTGVDYTGRPEAGDFHRYIDYMNTQLTELLTNYGEIGGIWFDGMWDQYDANWRLEETYALIHRLQPQALIGSNHHRLPYPGEDFQMFERDLPGHNTAGFNTTEIGHLPLEMCETMNGAWGFNIHDRNYKSTRELVQLLVKAAGYNANLLLNVGPMASGEIQPEFRDRLLEMGQWLGQYGEAIYGAKGGPVSPRAWGVTTQKGNTVYVHILNWPETDALWLPLTARVQGATAMKDGSRVTFVQDARGVLLHPVAAAARDAYDTIIALQLRP